MENLAEVRSPAKRYRASRRKATLRVAEAMQRGSTLTDAEVLVGLFGDDSEVVRSQIALALREHGSIAALSRLSAADLQTYFGEQRSALLLAAMDVGRRSLIPVERNVRADSPASVYALMRPLIAHLTREEFHVVLLDARHRVIATRRVAEGGLASCAISPRDVFEPAIREAAPAMVLVHNHPSGDPSPSADDVALTHRLVDGARVLGIRVVDHVVVATSGYSSLAELGKGGL